MFPKGRVTEMRAALSASVLSLVVTHTSLAMDSNHDATEKWSGVAIVDTVAWETTPRLSTYLEAIDREGGTQPWFNDLIPHTGVGLRDVRNHFRDRVLVEHRDDIILAWEAGESPASGEQLEVRIEGSPGECLRYLMARFGIAEPPWLPGEIRDWHIGDRQRMAKMDEKAASVSGRMDFRNALIQLALSADIRIMAVLDVSGQPCVLDIWLEGIAVYGLRDRRARRPPGLSTDSADAQIGGSVAPEAPSPETMANEGAQDANELRRAVPRTMETAPVESGSIPWVVYAVLASIVCVGMLAALLMRRRSRR